MPRILIIDTYYPDFLKSLPDPCGGDYETGLHTALGRCFGTFDAYSHNLKAEGWDACDVIANHHELQRRWAMEMGCPNLGPVATVLAQIAEFRPDVIFCQDLSYFDAATLTYLRKKYLLAGQCSCPMPAAEKVSKFNILFTSFPHYVDRFKALGVDAHYLPLAFDPRMLSEESPKKEFDISFVGGVGKQSHWKAGTEMLERVAAEFKERFIWFGYGRENLEAGSPLIPCYAGPVWGREMYRVYGRSKIVVNRHGEVAEGHTNNLRCYEAMGMGAVLLTEASPNRTKLFPSLSCVSYESTQHAIDKLTVLLNSDTSNLAKRGQQLILRHHTYAHRMKIVSNVLTAALVGQTA